MITKTAGENSYSTTRKSDFNETFNNIPAEKEISDEDTIVYTSGSNGKPLLASIEKKFDLNQVIRNFIDKIKYILRY